MVRYNRGKGFAKMSPILCGNGKVCKEYAKTVGGAGWEERRRGEGTPPYARIFKWGCRAASPLAAVAVCGGGKVPGRDESLPYGLNRRRDLAVSCGPGMPGPYRVVMGKRDVAAGWRAAYMRPLQIGGSLQLRGFGALGGAQRAPPASKAGPLVRLLAPQGQALLTTPVSLRSTVAPRSQPRNTRI